jgi:hypothetical protein
LFLEMPEASAIEPPLVEQQQCRPQWRRRLSKDRAVTVQNCRELPWIFGSLRKWALTRSDTEAERFRDPLYGEAHL